MQPLSARPASHLFGCASLCIRFDRGQDLRKRVDHSIEYDVTMPVVHDANPYTLSIATAMQVRHHPRRAGRIRNQSSAARPCSI